MLTRRAVQFHWFNRGYASFDDYLASLAQPKRKKIRAETRKVSAEGVVLERMIGSEITDATGICSCAATRHVRGASLDAVSEPPLFSADRTGDAEDPAVSSPARDGRSRPRWRCSITSVFTDATGARSIRSLPALRSELLPDDRIRDRAWPESDRRRCPRRTQARARLRAGHDVLVALAAHPAFADAVERYLQRESGGIEAYVDELNERSALRASSSVE